MSRRGSWFAPMPAVPCRRTISAVSDPDLLARFAAEPADDDSPPADDEPEFDALAWADAYDSLVAERPPALARGRD